MSIIELKVGLEIAEKLLGPEALIGGAGHDIIYLMPTDAEVSEEDRQKLEQFGWHYNKRDGWCHFA